MNISDITPIEQLGLSTRTTKHLKKNRIDTYGQLKILTVKELLCLPGLGNMSVAEIIRKTRKEDSIDYLWALIVNKDPSRTKVVHYIDPRSMTDPIKKYMFTTDENELVYRLDLDLLPFTDTQKTRLHENGIHTATNILEYNYDVIAEMDGLGLLAMWTILARLKERTFICYDTISWQKINNARELILRGIGRRCPNLNLDHIGKWVDVALYQCEDFTEDILTDIDALQTVYSMPAIYSLFGEYITGILLKERSFSIHDIKQHLPESLCASGILPDLINDLAANKKIDIDKERITYHLLSIDEYMDHLKDCPAKTALEYRLQGKRLVEIASLLDISVTYVTRLSMKLFKDVSFRCFRELEFVYWIENYRMTAEEFSEIFDESPRTYYFLIKVYGISPGRKDIGALINDPNAPAKVKERAETRLRSIKRNRSYRRLKTLLREYS